MFTLDIPLGPELSEEQAREIFAQGEEAVVWALLQQAKIIADAQAAQAKSDNDSPATPSGMKPTHTKPNASKNRRRKKKSGRKKGHLGSRRKKPDHVDQTKDHRADSCPDCGGPLNRCAETRTRYTEDIPEVIQPVVTEHVIHRDWCPNCKKKVEPPVLDALPKATLGHRLLVLTAWLHYGLGNTLSQIVEIFNFHLQMKVTPGGLLQMWYRLQEVLYPWYEEIQNEALDSSALHGDETGWRVNGITHWLWCFSTERLTYFLIDHSRGRSAVLKFFIREFAGILITDFWSAYNAVVCAVRQKCLVHLLRDLLKVEKYKSTSKDWPEFAKKLRRLIGDAIRLWRRREEFSAATYKSRRDRILQRLADLIEQDWENGEARRLVKRMRRHQKELFTFLDHENVPFENNHAERTIRPAVIIRKNSYGNRSEAGANAQAVLMSIFSTLKKRGYNPMQIIVQALRTYVQTGKLPPLPK